MIVIIIPGLVILTSLENRLINCWEYSRRDFFYEEIYLLLGVSKARDFFYKGIYLLLVLSIGARITKNIDAFIENIINHLRDQLTIRKFCMNLLIIYIMNASIFLYVYTCVIVVVVIKFYSPIPQLKYVF